MCHIDMLFGNTDFLECFNTFLYTRHKIMCATNSIICGFSITIEFGVQR